MQRGDRVKVHSYPDKLLERVVWEECETYILVCLPEVYSVATLFETEPISTMGFPKEDVSLISI